MNTSAFAMLTRAASAAERNREDELAKLLTELRSALDPDTDPGDMLPLYYLAGFADRLNGRQETNLYLRRYEHPQIDLFYLLARHLPLLRAGELANAHLLTHLRGHTEATLLAIGIGRGRQESALLERVAAEGLPLRRLTVVAVDPAIDSLSAAEATLKETAARHGIDLTVHTVPAVTENLGEATWQTSGASPRPLLASASFALHHMLDPHPGIDARDAFFHRLRALDPAVVALCEPEGDHHRVSLPERFATSWHTFSTVFAAIDSTPLTRAEHDAMKSFFGREIINIVGAVDERDRYERHEPGAVWLDRLRRCGFHPTAPLDTTPFKRDLSATPDFTLRTHPDHLQLGFRGTPLVVVIAATPSP